MMQRTSTLALIISTSMLAEQFNQQDMNTLQQFTSQIMDVKNVRKELIANFLNHNMSIESIIDTIILYNCNYTTKDDSCATSSNSVTVLFRLRCSSEWENLSKFHYRVSLIDRGSLLIRNVFPFHERNTIN